MAIIEVDLFCGQSNMAGAMSNTGILPGYDNVLSNIKTFSYNLYYTFSHQVRQYTPGSRTTEPYPSHGWDNYFCNDYYGAVSPQFIAKCALSGSSLVGFGAWGEVGIMKIYLLQVIKLINRYHNELGDTVHFRRFFWTQGEAELGELLINGYSAALSKFFDWVVENTNSDITFVITKISINQTWYSAQRILAMQAEQDLMLEYPNCILVNTDNCSTQADNIHFDANGYKQLSDNVIAAIV